MCVAQIPARRGVGGGCVLYRPTQYLGGGRGAVACEFLLKYVKIVHFYAFFNHLNCALLSFFRLWANPHNLDYVSSLVTLRSLSYWAPSLPKWRFAQERRVIDQFQRAKCPALEIPVLYTAHGGASGVYVSLYKVLLRRLDPYWGVFTCYSVV